MSLQTADKSRIVEVTEKDLPLGPKGGTGAGVRTILTYLSSLAGRRV